MKEAPSPAPSSIERGVEKNARRKHDRKKVSRRAITAGFNINPKDSSVRCVRSKKNQNNRTAELDKRSSLNEVANVFSLT